MVGVVVGIGFTWRKERKRGRKRDLWETFDKQRRRESCAVLCAEYLWYRVCVMSSFMKKNKTESYFYFKALVSEKVSPPHR